MFGARDHRLHGAGVQSPGSTKHVEEWIGSEICQELGWLQQAGSCSAPHCILQQQQEQGMQLSERLAFGIFSYCRAARSFAQMYHFYFSYKNYVRKMKKYTNKALGVKIYSHVPKCKALGCHLGKIPLSK